MMVKLYRNGKRGLLYWEAWEADGEVVVHKGAVGQRGETNTLPIPLGVSGKELIRHEMRRLLDDGFWPVPEEEQGRIVVRYAAARFRDRREVDRIWGAVEQLLNERLGWLGLGRCEAVDFSGELTFVATTVDPDLAVQVLRQELDGSQLLDQATVTIDEDRAGSADIR